jgi:hypothetical protein
MWNTLNPRGQSSPQRLLDPGIRETDGQRAAVLDCYEEVAPESIEMSAHLKPRRCSGVPAFEADRRNNLKPNINEAIAESDLLTLAEVAARLWCSKAHVCHAIRGQVKGVTLLPGHFLLAGGSWCAGNLSESWLSQNDPFRPWWGLSKTRRHLPRIVGRPRDPR